MLRCRFLVFLSLIGLGLGLSGWASRPFQKGPDFTLTTLSGEILQLAKINREKPVLLIFWATWCPSCREEIPALNAIYQKYHPDRLQLLAVNVQETVEELSKFVKTQPIHYPVLLDLEGEAAEKYQIQGLPVSVLLAKGGKILYYGFSLPGNLDELLEIRRV